MKVFLLSCLLAFSITVAQAQQPKDPRVIAYFAGNISQLDSFDVTKLTHIIFCFGHLNGNQYRVDNAKDTAIIRKMVTLKKINPALKVILSLGGWGGCETCSFAFSTPEGRQEFASEFKKLNDYFGTDGLDLDWEYPTIRLDNDIDKNPVHQAGPADRDNFTDLARRIRRELGPVHELSFAAGGFDTYLTGSVDWAAVMPEINYVNLMSYDIINGYSTETGHHTALYSTPKQKESTDNAVSYLLKIGVDPKKIIIGAAFYARVWENVPGKDNGLYQKGKFKEGFSFSSFPQKLNAAAGFETYWDDTAKAPWSYNKKKKLFATYDDKRSIREKTNYVISKGLGGIMFWELSNDLYKDGLVDIIIETIRAKK
ncbi:MAG: glycoside hydrolase [Chitinophagaceae bacterium]|nr:MAG: glycoside hydrolase [Chitinophagaceae bacterium]